MQSILWQFTVCSCYATQFKCISFVNKQLMSDKIKVLVLGDSGVGKSSFVHLICHSKPITNTSWTIGCSIDVKHHEYKQGTPQQRTCFIQLWDVGGSRSHSIARNIFYNSIHGIILVYDLTNMKSYLNLRKWLGQVFYNKDSMSFKENMSASRLSAALFPVAPLDDFEFDLESFFEKNIPVLIVGTKFDQIQNTSTKFMNLPFADECGAEEIQIDCLQSKSLAAGSTNSVKLSRFFDKVIQRKYHGLTSYQDKPKRQSVNKSYINKYN